MPTPANAINNSIDVLGWSHRITGGGGRKNSQKYLNWRSEVETKIRSKGWQWKKDGGTLYDAFVMECVALPEFPVSGASIIRRNLKTEDTKPAHKALNELMLDCFKKVRESQHKRRRALAREELAGEAETIVRGGESDMGRLATNKRHRVEGGRPIVMYILDPGNTSHHDPITKEWDWNLPGIKKLAVLYEASINELHVKISPHLPDGRKVREIIGALANAGPMTGGMPSDVTHIRSDEDLNAFLQLTEAKPIKLLVTLHKRQADGENTPPPEESNVGTYYFDLRRFDGREYYMDELEDSEEEVGKRAGGKRGFPRKDEKFEEGLSEIRRRIRRQQRLLRDYEAKHKAAYPQAIHDRDPGGDLRFYCYGPDDELSGKQIVKFRRVVAAYVADVAVRRAENKAAGGNLTEVEIAEAARAAIKEELDKGVEYAELGLPPTKA